MKNQAGKVTKLNEETVEARTGTTKSTGIVPHLFLSHPHQLTNGARSDSFFFFTISDTIMPQAYSTLHAYAELSPASRILHYTHSPFCGKDGKPAYMFEVPKWHKLDNVSKHGLALGRPQDAVIAVQHLHVTEISVAHADDDDGHGEVGGVDDGLSGVSHVCDDAVCQDQQDEVLLKVLDKK